MEFQRKDMTVARRPEWLRKKIDFSAMHGAETVLKRSGVRTVCAQARCPNISECFARKCAAFMILGTVCTRSCRFCNVTHGSPLPAADESSAVADAAANLGLGYAVVTSVTRDDIPDGGASLFAAAALALKKKNPSIGVELLVPDFMGSTASVETVVAADPDVFAHNVEMVPSLYSLRPGASYERSLLVLSAAKKAGARRTKSALMLGFGETRPELHRTLEDIRATGCDFLAIGQYLRPSFENVPVARYIEPDEFDEIAGIAYDIGFEHVESAPYVRSSYIADRYILHKD
jgi:lipoic acid synthetase